MIPTRIQGDFSGGVTEAVTRGFFSVLLRFVCLCSSLHTASSAGLLCHLNLGKSLHAWLAAEGWHAPGAQGRESEGGTVPFL